MRIILNEIFRTGTYQGLHVGDSIYDFKKLHPDALPDSESKKYRTKIFKLDPIQYFFRGDTLGFISMKCYYPVMVFVFENESIEIMHSTNSLKKLLENKNIAFQENIKMADNQLHLEVNKCVSLVYSIEDTGEMELAQIDSLIV